MAKNKGGCFGVVLMVGTFIGLCFACFPLFKKLTMAGIGNFCFVGLIVSVVVLIASIVMALIYKKPEFEDESFGHMLKRWLFGAIGAGALGAIFFFAIAPGQTKQKFATDAPRENAPAQESVQNGSSDNK